MYAVLLKNINGFIFVRRIAYRRQMYQQQLPESNLAHSILFKVSLILLIALFINVITQIQIINIVESLTFNENEPRKNVDSLRFNV